MESCNHNFAVAEPELRRHCLTCGLEQTGYEVNGKVEWEDASIRVYEFTSRKLDIHAVNVQ